MKQALVPININLHSKFEESSFTQRTGPKIYKWVTQS